MRAPCQSTHLCPAAEWLRGPSLGSDLYRPFEHDRLVVRPAAFLRDVWPEAPVQQPHPHGGCLIRKDVVTLVGAAGREPRVLGLGLLHPERDRALALRV